MLDKRPEHDDVQQIFSMHISLLKNQINDEYIVKFIFDQLDKLKVPDEASWVLFYQLNKAVHIYRYFVVHSSTAPFIHESV